MGEVDPLYKLHMVGPWVLMLTMSVTCANQLKTEAATLSDDQIETYIASV